jgi:hypothetical protein
MLTLATHQSATWGYSVLDYPSSETGITGAVGTVQNTGIFTKPTLAPNGNFYSIITNPSLTINGNSRTNVILEIVPGTTNTKNTNWSKCTFNYIYPDPSVTPDPVTGFSKPIWAGGSGSSAVSYNSGILAPNGLIYFCPLDFAGALSGGTYAWIVFDPSTKKWKRLNLHPSYPPSTYPNGIPYGYTSLLTSPILGSDGYMYVFTASLSTFFKFQPTTNASGDEASLQLCPVTFTTANHPLTGTNLTWIDESGTSYTDVASAASISYAYKKETSNGFDTLFNITDAIPHPNGNIYWIPGGGRGRIFYTKPSLFNTRPFVSAPGLLFDGSPQKSSYGYYAFLEKRRNADHDPTTLKIYIISLSGPNANYESRVICLDPVTNTLSYIDLGISSGTTAALGKNITLANGMQMSFNYTGGAGGVNSGRNILTGWDVPSSVTNGTRVIIRTNPGVLDNQLNSSITNSSTIIRPGYSKIGGGANAPYPHHSKFVMLATSDVSFPLFSELVSVKEYGPEITNFNFTDRDKVAYAPPTNLASLPTSSFNANFNKAR